VRLADVQADVRIGVEKARKAGQEEMSCRRSHPLLPSSNLQPRQIVYRWRCDDDKRDAEAVEIERLRDEGKTVVSIGWEKPPEDDGKLIEASRRARTSAR
jgi:hypothetical protein